MAMFLEGGNFIGFSKFKINLKLVDKMGQFKIKGGMK
jgi:hypothetical protein